MKCRYYQKIFSINIIFRLLSNITSKDRKKSDVFSLVPYITKDSDIKFDPENREKMRKTEIERQKCMLLQEIFLIIYNSD